MIHRKRPPRTNNELLSNILSTFIMYSGNKRGLYVEVNIRFRTNKKVPKNAEQYHCNCDKMLFGFLFYRFLMSTWIPFWIFYNFSMKKFCKCINFYFRPWREIVSKLAKELYTNWGNKSYSYCSIYFLLPFFFSINSILKNLNKVIFFSKFFNEEFILKTWNFILDHNALISIFKNLHCYHNFIITF